MVDGALAGQTENRAQVRIARHPMAGVVNAPGRRVALAARCGTCGAEVRKKVLALCCRSCGGLLVQDSDLTERARPDGLLPFGIDEDAARAAFEAWVCSRRFVPRTFRRGDRQVRALDGVFLPLWSFSANTVSDYVGERGDRRTRSVSGHARSYTQWNKATGRVGRYFDVVLVGGCSPLVQKLPRWPLDRLDAYTQGSSRGRRIIAYDVEPEYGFEQAKAFMSRQIERDARDDIGGSDQRVKGVTTTYNDPTYSLLLLPAWLLTYVHDGRTWSVLVNGATGQVIGDRPYSAAKISAAVAALISLVAVAAAIGLLHR